MPIIEVDFETFKEITSRRRNEAMSEGEVVKEALGLGLTATSDPKTPVWHSEGVAFAERTKLRHVFRGGKTVVAEITKDGVLSGGRIFKGLSPAAAYGAGHQANGWQFWEVQLADGRWVKADALRK